LWPQAQKDGFALLLLDGNTRAHYGASVEFGALSFLNMGQ
jgi:hypothetical protein